MTTDKLDLLAMATRAKELAEKATPGPWLPEPREPGHNVLQLFDGRNAEANTAFVRFARAALPLLAEGVVELMREMDSEREAMLVNALGIIKRSDRWQARAEAAEARLAEVERQLAEARNECQRLAQRGDPIELAELLLRRKMTKMDRKIIQIVEDVGNTHTIFVLCDDGSLWSLFLASPREAHWHWIEGLPSTAPKAD